MLQRHYLWILFLMEIQSALIKDWFELTVSHLSLTSSLVLLPSHWASVWALVIRLRLLIFVIHSDCGWPACTLTLIENLQMRSGRFGLHRLQLLTQWYSQLSGLRLSKQTDTLEVNHFIQWSKLWFYLCVSWLLNVQKCTRHSAISLINFKLLAIYWLYNKNHDDL